MPIHTIEGEHSWNMDELLTYLFNEQRNRQDLAIANLHDTDRHERESKAADDYRRMYEAAMHYRKDPQITNN